MSRLSYAVLRPGQVTAEACTAEPSLRLWQRLVGGYVEAVHCGVGTLLVDEEAGLKGSPPNEAASHLLLAAGMLPQWLMGTAVLLGPDAVRGEFTSVAPEGLHGLAVVGVSVTKTMGLSVAIDADCPACGKPERAFDPARSVFTCSSLGGGRCGYESTERNA